MAQKSWKGCFISESLKDPTILNDIKCYQIRITEANLPIDEDGNIGRWHMYWMETPNPPI